MQAITVTQTELLLGLGMWALVMVLLTALGARLTLLQAHLAKLGRVEAKVDLLLKQANIKYDPYKDISPDIMDAVRAGNKIQAIKLYRVQTGQGLAELKNAIEEIMRRT